MGQELHTQASALRDLYLWKMETADKVTHHTF